MSIEPLIVDGIAIAEDVVGALIPVIASWIHSGNVDAIQSLRTVIDDAPTLAHLDRALEAAQRAKAEQELGT